MEENRKDMVEIVVAELIRAMRQASKTEVKIEIARVLLDYDKVMRPLGVTLTTDA